MKRVLLLLLFIGVLATACDPDWALNPQNEGRAYIVNKTDADIIFRGTPLGDRYIQNTRFLQAIPSVFQLQPGMSMRIIGII